MEWSILLAHSSPPQPILMGRHNLGPPHHRIHAWDNRKNHHHQWWQEQPNEKQGVRPLLLCSLTDGRVWRLPQEVTPRTCVGLFHFWNCFFLPVGALHRGPFIPIRSMFHTRCGDQSDFLYPASHVWVFALLFRFAPYSFYAGNAVLFAKIHFVGFCIGTFRACDTPWSPLFSIPGKVLDYMPYLYYQNLAIMDEINVPSSNLTYPVWVCLELKSCDFSLGQVFPITPGIFILALVTG